MSIVATANEARLRHAQGGATPDEVRAKVGELLAWRFPQRRMVDRRSDQRYPFPELVLLTPVEACDDQARQESVVAVGKHISESGLGFYHPAPLPHRRVIASFEVEEGRWVAFLMDLKWCRFTCKGWYESGGTFLQSVVSPFDDGG